MELRTLRYFLAVAYEGNITHAAQSLYISQPSLTRQIQLLEEELDCKLFVRKRHSVELTSEGLELRSRAIEALQIIEHIEHDFASRSDQEISGSVFIAAAETEGMRTIARVASRLRTKHPGIVIELTTGDAFSVADRLDKGLADVSVFCEPANVAKYHSRRLPEMDTWGVLMRAMTHSHRRRQSYRRTSLTGPATSAPSRGAPSTRPILSAYGWAGNAVSSRRQEPSTWYAMRQP